MRLCSSVVEQCFRKAKVESSTLSRGFFFINIYKSIFVMPIMRFRDFVYSFQKYSETRVNNDEDLKTWLSQAYNSVSGSPKAAQEDQARICAEMFRIGKREGERRLELRLMEGITGMLLSSGGAGVAVEY